MLVDVKKLLEAIGRTTWKHGLVKLERVKHTVDANGDHTITIVLHRDEAEWAPPAHLSRPSWGGSTPDGTGGTKKS
jgi:hypothetical protein